VDCQFSSIEEPAALEAEIKRLPGALENGLFVGVIRAAVIAGGGANEGTRIIER
jgi:ribose 5-phosphate isomerase A